MLEWNLYACMVKFQASYPLTELQVRQSEYQRLENRRKRIYFYGFSLQLLEQIVFYIVTLFKFKKSEYVDEETTIN